jgi:beta-phosphoglucomutase-like phosphatase (HAD superfamily)
MQSAVLGYKATGFDHDGTLLDNLKKAIGVYRVLRTKRGYSTQKTEEEETYEFRNEVEADFPGFLAKKGISPTQEELRFLDRKYLSHLQKKGKYFPNAHELLEFLYKSGVRTGIASEASRRIHIDTMLDKTGSSNYVMAVVGREDKRNENKWVVLAHRLKVEPKEMIVADDMTQGIDSAHQAGVGKVYAVAHERSFHSREKLSDHIQKMGYKNTEIVGDLYELQEKLTQDLKLTANRVNDTKIQPARL